MPNAWDSLLVRRLKLLVDGSRRRAARSGMDFDLPEGHAEAMFQAQQERCAISGLEFSMQEFPGVLVKHPFAPSIDRIRSGGGYTTDNVRLVCVAINFGMGQWGDELYLRFARAAIGYTDHARLANIAEAAAKTSETAKGADEIWSGALRDRIAAAEGIASQLAGKPLQAQRRHIAALKRSLTLGRAGLRSAAEKAHQTRNR